MPGPPPGAHYTVSFNLQLVQKLHFPEDLIAVVACNLDSWQVAGSAALESSKGLESSDKVSSSVDDHACSILMAYLQLL